MQSAPTISHPRTRMFLKGSIFMLKTIISIITFIMALIITVLFIYQRGRKTNYSTLILKSLSSVGFLLVSCCGIWYSMNFTALLILAGQIFGLLGDVFLDLKYTYPQDSHPYTIWGFLTFLTGHLFFIAFLIIQHSAYLLFMIFSLAIGIIVAIILYFGAEKIAKLILGQYRLISAFYIGVLCTVTVLSLLVSISGGLSEQWILTAGLLFFLASDAVLSQIYFTPNNANNTPVFVRTNLILYYAAQLCISASIFFLAA